MSPFRLRVPGPGRVAGWEQRINLAHLVVGPVLATQPQRVLLEALSHVCRLCREGDVCDCCGAGAHVANAVRMTLDRGGVLLSCPSCRTTNRLRYDALGRATRCPKCQTALPLPNEPIEVKSTADFDAAVHHSSVPIVVDFWAAWCGPCRMVAPEITKAAEHLAGRALVLKVDTDANPELSSRFGIRSIPTIGVFSNGREINRVSGVRAAAAIEAMVPQSGQADLR